MEIPGQVKPTNWTLTTGELRLDARFFPACSGTAPSLLIRSNSHVEMLFPSEMNACNRLTRHDQSGLKQTFTEFIGACGF